MAPDSFSDQLKSHEGSGTNPQLANSGKEIVDPTSGNSDGELADGKDSNEPDRVDNANDLNSDTPTNNDPAVLDAFRLARSAAPEKNAVINSAYQEVDEEDADQFDLTRDGGNDGNRRVVNQAFIAHSHLDPMRQRDPHGVYLDDQRAIQAEVIRAQIEDREPDLENPGPTVGTPMVPLHVAAQHAMPGVIVEGEIELPVVVGDYSRDEYGRAVDDDGKILTEGGEPKSNSSEDDKDE